MESKKILVKGTAIRQGVSRNKMKYLATELTSFAPTLTNKPILKDHTGTVDSTVGLLTHTFTDDNGESVKFEGWVKDDNTGVGEKVQDGRIKEVSIGAIAKRVVKESEDSDELIPRGLEGMELSLTPIPGVVGTSISQSVPLTEHVNMFKNIEERKEVKMDVKEMVACPDCGKEVADKAELSKHMEDKHMEEEKAKTQLQENMKAVAQALKETQELKLSLLKEKYETLCEKKKIKPSVFTTEEELKAFIKVTETLEVPKVQEAQFQSKPVEQPDMMAKLQEGYEGIVFERSSLGRGVSFYKETIDHPKFKTQSNSHYKVSVKSA